MGFISSILAMIPNVVWAIILLVIAFIAAKIVKSLVTKLLKAVKAEKLLSKIGLDAAAADGAIAFIAKLAYFVTFLLFLPGVLDKLDMQSVSSPITDMVDSFLGFIPNLVGAGIIVAIGIFVANIVKQLLIPILKAIKVDELQKKAGIEAEESAALSTILANVVYALIILVVITSALDQLGVSAISEPANAVVNTIFAAIPNVLGAIVIIAIGVFISQLVAKLLEALLAGVGADSLIEKITKNDSNKVVLSKVIATIVKYVLIVIFVVEGINILNLAALTSVGAAVIGYMPSVLAAIIILGVGIFAAKLAGDAIVKKFPNAKASALVAKAAIYVLVAFLCLSQLGVASAIVETAFIVIIAALGIAFAIAFGVGGRQFAANMLDKLEKKIDDNDNK